MRLDKPGTLGRPYAMTISADQLAFEGFFDYGLPSSVADHRSDIVQFHSPDMIKVKSRNVGDSAAVGAFTTQESNKCFLVLSTFFARFCTALLGGARIPGISQGTDMFTITCLPSIAGRALALSIVLDPVPRRVSRLLRICDSPGAVLLADLLRIPFRPFATSLAVFLWIRPPSANGRKSVLFASFIFGFHHFRLYYGLRGRSH